MEVREMNLEYLQRPRIDEVGLGVVYRRGSLSSNEDSNAGATDDCNVDPRH